MIEFLGVFCFCFCFVFGFFFRGGGGYYWLVIGLGGGGVEGIGVVFKEEKIFFVINFWYTNSIYVSSDNYSFQNITHVPYGTEKR